MNKFLDWVKTNKFAAFVILFLLIFAWKSLENFFGVRPFARNMSYEYAPILGSDMAGIGAPSFGAKVSNMGLTRPTMQEPAPFLDTANRKVIANADMSLQVSNISEAISAIQNRLKELQGILLDRNVNRPEFGENATVTVRVPTDKLEEFMAFAREMSVKVVSENIYGTDVTDQYVDTETRLTQLRRQLAMLENILASAKTVDEIMKVQPYITSVQSEIDALVGQNNYLDKSSQTSRITLYLSTDELSLPYTPDLAWRPQAVFKNAVRSLLVTLQQVGSAVIWLGVYSVLIVPAFTVLLIVYLALKRKGRI
jgi:hypothetical protein